MQAQFSVPSASEAPPIVGANAITRASVVRSQALDFAKGFLVLIMVVYHCLNYFAQQVPQSGPHSVYGYIKFVSGGFIFISGYIVAAFYNSRWKQEPGRVTLRLVTRGLKLLALFTAISLVLSLLSVSNYRGRTYDLDNFFDHALQIYTTGYTRVVAFYILVPIAYVLIVSPLLLWLQRFRVGLLVCLVVGLVSALLLRRSLNNLTMMLIGGVGILSGLMVPSAKLASRRYLPVSFTVLVAWVALLPWWGSNLLGYILYIMIVLKFVADTSDLLPEKSNWKRATCLLGEYVLFCYLAQIFLLQFFQRLFWRNFKTPLSGVVLIMLVASAALFAACWILDAARRRFRFVDQAYRLVFA
jgi:hypothetical protein